MSARGLIERVEQGSGRDGALNADVHEALGLPFEMEYWTESSTVPTPNKSKVPQYVTSVDAVIALIEAKLPGWCPDVGKVPAFALSQGEPEWSGSLMGNEREVVLGHGEPPEMTYDTFNGHASSGARALLAATLRALQIVETLADAHSNSYEEGER